MYFVTTKHEGYVLFCTTPSERAAVGLTEHQIVHLFVRVAKPGKWEVLHEWSAKDYSATEFLSALHHVDEPEDPRQLVEFLPANLRQRRQH